MATRKTTAAEPEAVESVESVASVVEQLPAPEVVEQITAPSLHFPTFRDNNPTAP